MSLEFSNSTSCSIAFIQQRSLPLLNGCDMHIQRDAPLDLLVNITNVFVSDRPVRPHVFFFSAASQQHPSPQILRAPSPMMTCFDERWRCCCMALLCMQFHSSCIHSSSAIRQTVRHPDAPYGYCTLQLSLWTVDRQDLRLPSPTSQNPPLLAFYDRVWYAAPSIHGESRLTSRSHYRGQSGSIEGICMCTISRRPVE